MKSLKQSIQENLIFEKHGVAEGLVEFAERITKHMFNWANPETKKTVHYRSFYDRLKEKIFPNVFFEEIQVEYAYDYSGKKKSDGFYIISKSPLTDNGLLELVEIKINANTANTKEYLHSILVHELTHAYEDYCRKLNNGVSMIDVKTIFDKAKHIKGNPDDEFGPDDVELSEYMLMSHEVNAFITTIHSTMHRYKYELCSFNNFLTKIKYFNDDKLAITLKTYYDFYDLFNEYIFRGEKRKDIVEKYVKIYNEMFHTDYDEDKLREKMIQRFSKVIKKFIKTAGKVFCDTYVGPNAIKLNVNKIDPRFSN
ncbi:MAG: hypothetical protein J6D03_00260 [Clostridia bacterium]|nr:hypothetical protein [Clostridia bacterium]